MMTDSSAEQHSADDPDGVSCKHGLQLQDHLHIKKEEEELWESLEEKQETDITAVTVKSEDEEEEAQCSLLHWRQSEENIKGEPATCSSAKLLKVEPHGDISEGPEAANTCSQPDTDGEETDCSDTEDSEDWREPLSQSEAQSEHMDMSCDSTHTSENNIKGPSHNTQKPFCCDVCGKRFGHRGHLKIHTRIHTGEKPFGCDVCRKRFSNRTDFNKHTRIHTGEKPYGCDVCGKQFTRQSNLKIHTTIHTGEKPFGCDVCEKGFCHKSKLKNHMRIHTGEKPYGCDVCSKKFNRKSNLSKHMRSHTGEKAVGCDVNDQTLQPTASHAGKMTVHILEKPVGCDEEPWESLEEKQGTDITAVTVKSEDEEEEAQCSLLHWRQSEENIKGEPATCSSAKLLKVEPHGDISEGPEAANTCSQPDTDGEETDCSDTEDSEDWREPLSQSEAQSEHMDMSCDSFHTSENTIKGTSHNREKRFGCDVCGKRFTHKRSIFTHRRIHTGEKPHGCDLCEKRFDSKAHLKIHMRSHTGEKPFSCDVCGKQFSYRSNHSRHMRGHTGEKPFGCDVCGKRFSIITNLNVHTRIHTGEKCFGCDVCGKLFTQRSNQSRHMKRHTGEKRWL